MIRYVIKEISTEGHLVNPRKYAWRYSHDRVNVFQDYNTIDDAHDALKEYAAGQLSQYQANGFLILPMFVHKEEG